MTVEERLAREVETRGFSPDPAQRDAARRLDCLARALRARERRTGSRLQRVLQRLGMGAADREPVRGLYLWGGVGRGKTHLMNLFFESLDLERREREHFYRFMREVHRALRDFERTSDPLDALAERIAKRTRVICFDEFFVSDIGDAMILDRLFAGLFERGVSLVATSNVAPKDLYKDGLQRQRFLPAIELIERHVEVCNLEGGIDYRLRHLQQGGTYLDANDPAAAARMKRLFDALCSGGAEGARVLRIEDRDIRAVNRCDGVVWFEFEDLCEGPRSQNDYIELAHSYHTIFLTNIPVLDEQRENAARRLIMLVDEAYDRGVNLVISAAAAPTEIYKGERLTLEFARTSSRLIEMQSQSYLAGEHRA